MRRSAPSPCLAFLLYAPLSLPDCLFSSSRSTIVTFGAVAFFLKYLDSSNINNAYVSG